ncbi:MAG: rhamnulokinase family protein [Caldilineaceae bacterium]
MSRGGSYLAFDLGAESGRAILGQIDEAKLTLTEVHRFANTPVLIPTAPGQQTLHWDAPALWREIKTGLAAAAAQPGQIRSMGLDTWGVDFGLLDRNGALLANPVHYRDSRTDGMMEAAFERVPQAEIFAQTGIQFMQLNSLYQLLALVRSQSPLLDVAETFLTMPDLFNYWLTGRKAAEFTNATTTQCYNPLQRDWAHPMLEKLGIPTALFPEVVQPGSVLGPLRSEIAAEVSASGITVVTPACHDTGSAVAAVPASGEDFVWISSGTWSILGVEVNEAVVNAQALTYNLTNEGGVNGTYRLCKNVMGMWPIQESLRVWSRAGQNYSYADLAPLAQQAAPLRFLIDPDHDDFLKPGDMPARIRAFCRRTGQGEPESHAQIVRCVLESLALKYRLVLENLEALLGRPLQPIHIVGGGSQNALLNQFTADATGKQVITGPVEATATGNILVQALALGDLSSLQEGRALVRRTTDLGVYEPGARAPWDQAFGRFKAMIGAA